MLQLGFVGYRNKTSPFTRRLANLLKAELCLFFCISYGLLDYLPSFSQRRSYFKFSARMLRKMAEISHSRECWRFTPHERKSPNRPSMGRQ